MGPGSAVAGRTLGRVLAPWLVAAAVATLYLPSLGNDFVYDDTAAIVDQPRPQRAADVWRVFAEPHIAGLPYYRPVIRATYLGQKALHGDRPAAFRAVNIAIMAAAALLAYALLRSPGMGVERTPALLAAALFTVHPVASSCVYPILGRDSGLAAVLILAATLAWVRGRRAWAYAAFAAALFAKEQSVVVVMVFALADLCRVGIDPPGTSIAVWVRRHAPSVAILAVYVAVRHAVAGVATTAVALSGNPPLIPLSFLYLLQVTVAPFAQLVYEPEVATWLSPFRLGVALLAVGALAWASRRVGAPPIRTAAFWVGWVVATQLPTANVLAQEARFAERYAFLATLAFPAVTAAVVSARWHSRAVRASAVSIAMTLILVASAVSLHRGRYFRDDESFARQWLRTDPDSSDAHHALGMILYKQGRLDEALRHYDAALQPGAAAGNIESGRGGVLILLGRLAEARTALRAALEVEPDHPGAHFNLGLLHFRSGELDAAVVHFRAAIRAAPYHVDAHNHLGKALLRQGEFSEAGAHFAEARRLRPDHAETHRYLGVVRLRQGRRDEARASLEEALRLNPDDAWSRRQLERVRSGSAD